MNQISLLDEAKEITGSDYMTAKRLGISKQRISTARTGNSILRDEIIGQLGELVGRDPWQTICEVRLEAASSFQERKLWKRWAGAACLMIGVGAVCAITLDSTSYAAILPLIAMPRIYIMRTSVGLCAAIRPSRRWRSQTADGTLSPLFNVGTGMNSRGVVLAAAAAAFLAGAGFTYLVLQPPAVPDQAFSSVGQGRTVGESYKAALADAERYCGYWQAVPSVQAREAAYRGGLTEDARTAAKVAREVAEAAGRDFPNVSAPDDYETTLTYRCFAISR